MFTSSDCWLGLRWVESESRLGLSNFLRPHILCSPWNFPGQNTGVVSLPLFWGLPNPDIKPVSPALCVNCLLYEPRFLFFVFSLVHSYYYWSSVQFNSVAQSCPTLCDPMNRSTPGLPVHHQLPELTQTHVHRVGDTIQPSHPLSSPSPPAPNPSQHQGLFQWINSSHGVAKLLEFQLQHQSF